MGAPIKTRREVLKHQGRNSGVAVESVIHGCPGDGNTISKVIFELGSGKLKSGVTIYVLNPVVDFSEQSDLSVFYVEFPHF